MSYDWSALVHWMLIYSLSNVLRVILGHPVYVEMNWISFKTVKDNNNQRNFGLKFLKDYATTQETSWVFFFISLQKKSYQ